MQKICNTIQEILAINDSIIRKSSKSGGKGGQRTNKVSTKAELYFSIPDSVLLTEKQKQRLLKELNVSKEGVYRISYGRGRHLTHNQQKCREIFVETVTGVLIPQKKREKELPQKVVAKIRQQKEKEKKHLSQKKKYRSKRNILDD